ncbi:hypothetical protein MKW98_028243, partial [Papaver atlanticum]
MLTKILLEDTDRPSNIKKSIEVSLVRSGFFSQKTRRKVIADKVSLANVPVQRGE